MVSQTVNKYEIVQPYLAQYDFFVSPHFFDYLSKKIENGKFYLNKKLPEFLYQSSLNYLSHQMNIQDEKLIKMERLDNLCSIAKLLIMMGGKKELIAYSLASLELTEKQFANLDRMLKRAGIQLTFVKVI